MEEPRKYPVNDLYATVQGEGVLTGTPMILLRLHGCDVGCPWCDTKETRAFDQLNEVDNLGDALGATSKWVGLTAQQIADTIQRTYRTTGVQWVLITGGEPANYPLRDLIDHLHALSYMVAVETSGTAVGVVDAGADHVCVSPKINMPGGLPILRDPLWQADEIKHVVGKQGDIDQLQAMLMKFGVLSQNPNVQICLQPVSQSEKATRLCVATCLRMGWRLSIQTHKLIDQR